MPANHVEMGFVPSDSLTDTLQFDNLEAFRADINAQLTQLNTDIGDLTITGLSFDYTPANLADWSGTAPTSLADALDRIAAALTPIP